MTDPTPRALLDAYIAETKMPVSLSYQREQTLSALVAIGMTADDVRLVMRELARLVRSTQREHECFTPSCLEFRNALGNPDRFEERVLRLRQEAARRLAARPKPLVAQTDAAGVTRLVDAPGKEAVVIDASAALRSLASEIDGRKSA